MHFRDVDLLNVLQIKQFSKYLDFTTEECNNPRPLG